MDDKIKQEFINLFNQGFQELVVPLIDELIEGQERIGKSLGTVETRLDVVERKLDRVVDEHITHEKRIKRLESQGALT